VRANREYRLNHTRGGPRLFAAPDAVDSVEIVEIASGELVLFWDVARRDARRFVGALKADLASLESAVFLERWSAIAGPADL
jgi:hypothetical protein